MVGNLNDMSFDQPFDYVVVNGVLEYAMSFTKGDTPYETFLENMGQYLNEAGKILIAIENKLGLKYFAGAPEDHTDLHFFGINRYPGNHTVRTEVAFLFRSFIILILIINSLQRFLQMKRCIRICMEKNILSIQIRRLRFFPRARG